MSSNRRDPNMIAPSPTSPLGVRLRRGVAAIALLGLGAVGAQVVLPELGIAQTKTSDTYRQLDLFSQVFERVRADYVEKVSDEQLIEAAINGMLTSLDPHSSYLNPKNFRDMQVQTRGEFGGIGAEVSMEQGVVKVVSPIDDTPASKAGIKPGDYITHINGESVIGLNLNEAIEKLRGPINSEVTLTIRREGRDAFDLKLARAAIKIESVRGRLEGPDVAYVRITSFNEQTESGMVRAIQRAKEQAGPKLRGLVLDLRRNPGGLLDQAIAVSDAFLEKGEVVSTSSPRKPEQAQRFNAKPGDLMNGLPIVVLIDDGSASASEIVAGALQDHRRAIVMGVKSFGKGSVQTIMPLGQGTGAMRLTTSLYYTPSGRSIQQTGIEPDIVVPLSRVEKVDTGERRSEANLRGSIRNPTGGAQPIAPQPAPQAEEEQQPLVLGSAEDYQLQRAVDLVRGIAMFSVKPGN